MISGRIEEVSRRSSKMLFWCTAKWRKKMALFFYYNEARDEGLMSGVSKRPHWERHKVKMLRMLKVRKKGFRAKLIDNIFLSLFSSLNNKTHLNNNTRCAFLSCCFWKPFNHWQVFI